MPRQAPTKRPSWKAPHSPKPWLVRREMAARLFVGLGTPEASCQESFYVEPNSHMFGKNVIAVREAYRRHGLEIERLHREPDHLGLMLGFLSRGRRSARPSRPTRQQAGRCTR
ncbi:MAG: molecular chaperone [Adlercreutzia equolifaciens]